MQNIDLVVKIGSMALIQKEDSVIDYNVFQRLAMAVWTTFSAPATS